MPSDVSEAMDKAIAAMVQAGERLELAQKLVDQGDFEQASVELSYLSNEAVKAIGAWGFVIGYARSMLASDRPPQDETQH